MGFDTLWSLVYIAKRNFNCSDHATCRHDTVDRAKKNEVSGEEGRIDWKILLKEDVRVASKHTTKTQMGLNSNLPFVLLSRVTIRSMQVVC
jgi:hypothetical protein